MSDLMVTFVVFSEKPSLSIGYNGSTFLDTTLEVPVLEGGNVSLDCRWKGGLPKASPRWNTDPLASDYAVIPSEDGSSQRLTLSNVHRYDMGRIHCEARNVAGGSRISFTLLVLCKYLYCHCTAPCFVSWSYSCCAEDGSLSIHIPCPPLISYSPLSLCKDPYCWFSLHCLIPVNILLTDFQFSHCLFSARVDSAWSY